MTLDETDARLVAALREDGRASFEALGGQLGLSRKVARTRAQRLFDEGVVRVVATVRPEFDDIHAIAHLSITVAGAPREQVARTISEKDQTVFVSVVSGQANLVVEVRARHLVELTEAIDGVRAAAGVDTAETLVYSAVVKEPHLPPPAVATSEAPLIDDVDRALVRLLRTDGRATYADLAVEVGLSAAATRVRVRSLLDAGVIRIVALVNPTRLGRSFMTGFALGTRHPSADLLDRIGEIDSVEFLARTIGTADAIGTIVTTSLDDALDVLDQLAAMDGVERVRSWTHLRLVKERYEQVR